MLADELISASDCLFSHQWVIHSGGVVTCQEWLCAVLMKTINDSGLGLRHDNIVQLVVGDR